ASPFADENLPHRGGSAGHGRPALMSQATTTHVARQRSVKCRSGTVTAVAELAPQTLDLTDDQREIQALAREFARTEIRPVSGDRLTRAPHHARERALT